MCAPAAAQLRVVRSGPLAPARNLAVDAALLETPGPATLRIYGWAPAGLSLGRFQDPAAFRGLPGPHALVRRQTGGGAIYHGDELTFALTLDERPDWTIEAAYAAVHDALRRALSRFGVRCERRTADGPPQSPRALRAAWCFERPGRHDLVAPDGRKLCGSAQRRIRRPSPRVLHHGSLVVRCPDATPFCASIADQVDPEPIRAGLTDAIVDELALVLGLEPRAGELSTAEVRLATAREAEFGIWTVTGADLG
jgi:lipoate-protein ligase A